MGIRILRAVLLAVLPVACSRSGGNSSAAAPEAGTLKGAYQGAFLVGAAVNNAQFTGRDSAGVALIRAQFNTITPENVLKWEAVHPRPGEYNWGPADAYVDFGTRNGMFVIGHTLVWHNQTPAWVFRDAAGNQVGRDTLLARLREHIMTVVGRYKGRIKGWDVVNEAVNEDGTMRRSLWYTIIGDDFLVKAFQFAHEADPDAELYYNDYSIENAAKRDGAVRLIRSLQAAGIPVHAMGLQDHNNMTFPTVEQLDTTIAAFAALGVKVNITELDIDLLPRAARRPGADLADTAGYQQRLNPYSAGLPDSVQQALARRYADLFQVYWKHRDAIERVTFWGVADGDSWLNNWPVRGRSSYPLLFDRQGSPKPAFEAVLNVSRQGAAAR